MTRPTYPILGLCIASFLLATAVAWGVFEAMPHLEDEHANYFQAKVFARGRITSPAEPIHSAFFVPNVIHKNEIQFSKYPPGYPLLLAISVWLKQPWLVNSLAAALGILATYLLGRDLFDRSTGLLAAMLGVISPMYVMLSGTLLAHSTCLTALVFFAWAFIRARRLDGAHRNGFAWMAGALAGLALIIRPWTSLGIGLPFALFAAIDLVRQRGVVFKIYWRMLIAFIAMGTLWQLYNFVATGNPFTNTYTLVWDYDTIGFGQQFGRGHYWEIAVFIFSLGWYMFATVLTGWPVLMNVSLVWVVIGLGIFLPPRHKRDIAILIPPVALTLAYLVYWASSTGVYGPRYYAEGMPFLWLVAARGLQKASAFRIGFRAIQIGLPLCIVWGIFFSILPRFLEAKGLYEITRADARHIASAGIHHALVLVQSDEWSDYASLSWLNAADLHDSDIVFAEEKDEATNRAIIQTFPGRAVYSYDRHRLNALIPITFGEYTQDLSK